MKMEQKVKQFDRNKVKEVLEEENGYIIDLLSTFGVPNSTEDHDLNIYLLDTQESYVSPTIKDFAKTKVQTPNELEEMLQIIKNKMISKKPKISEHSVKRKEQKTLKKLKKFKKKLGGIVKVPRNEEIKEKVLDEENRNFSLNTKPIFNVEGKIVFSKFDFASHPGAKIRKAKRDKIMKNPKEVLKAINQQIKEVSELREKGEEEKVREMKKTFAWKKAFDKIEGKKIKDNRSLLEKAIRRRKVEKKKSKEKWTERKIKVEQAIVNRQKKRQGNIADKLKRKKIEKLKRMSKKGRVIPGF